MAAQKTVTVYHTTVSTSDKIRSDCDHVLNLLGMKRIPFAKVNLAMEPERREAMRAVSGVPTLPQIHITTNGTTTYFGGWTELEDANDSGRLEAILQ
eukprot:gnl/Spiro4/18741_TR10017_c0_g1_i1.p2 gnl/Spiro4/18741_TR10017_c0_g1~~gnl/Spiro4/18741_TR10017_c0_g1_i1.p2  ORF type:complete len:109 (+),score=34.89 gnl/Spiro4/18741_TR10017_c0_g1_i1:37-327(+)